MRDVCFAAMVLVCLAVLAPASSAREYTVATLPGPGCPACNFAEDVNDLGQVLFTNAVVVPGIHVESYGINDVGDIVGADVTNSRGFIRSGSGVLSTFAVPGANLTVPLDVNNVGLIVGYARFGSAVGAFVGFVRTPDGQFSTFEFPGAGSTFGTSINDGGQVVGRFEQGGPSVSFLKEGTTFRILPTPQAIRDLAIPGLHCRGIRINNLGQILGNCSVGLGAFLGYLQHGSTDAAPADVLEFGSNFTETIGFSNAGRIVGVRSDLSGLKNFLATPQLPPTQVVSAVLPSSRSVTVGMPATAFVTIINGGSVAALNVGMALDTLVPAAFSYQTTDSETNAPIGAPNTPADIPSGGSQSYVISILPNAEFSPVELTFTFSGTNADAAPVFIGTNTLLMSASSDPAPDIVALAAATGGILAIPSSNGANAFAVASVNVSVGALITVTADTGAATPPVTLTLCQTNPTSGACVNPSTPASSVTVQMNPNETPTFSIFAQATGEIPFRPDVNRVHVRFTTLTGGRVGSTSVAVLTGP